MRWDEGHQSADIEDRRGGGGGLPFLGGGRLGCGGFVLVLALSLLFRKNLFSLFGGASVSPGGARPTTAEEEKLKSFSGFVLDDTQKVWAELFRARGERYERAKLVLFTDSTRTSGCGLGEAAMGPFYCPADKKVYLDLGFFHDLRRRFGAPGDFAGAYVIAHEIGHHVQTLLGIEARTRAEQRRRPSEANALSVKLELQADCFAGVWARSTSERKLLEAGDVEEALGAAAAIGDDRLQRRSGREVSPETWTHGSSEMRVRSFKRGFEGGTVEACL